MKAILHLLKIHRKMIFGNTSIIVEYMLGKTPKTFNSVNVILSAFVDHVFLMRHGMMFAQAFQRIVASEFVGVVHRTFSRFLPDNSHKFGGGDMLHHSRVDLSIALQKAKYDVFTYCSASSLALASAAKVALIHLHLAVQLSALKLGDMVDRFTETLVHTGDRLIIKTEIMRQAIRRLLLIETLHYGYFLSDSLQRLLSFTEFVSASDIASLCPAYLERTAENALSTLQKVGRTTEYIVFSHTHETIVPSHGYESN